MTETSNVLSKFDGADCAYSVSDDSMSLKRILPGDVVFVKQQHTVENGDIALVLYNGEVRIGTYAKFESCETLAPGNYGYKTILSRFDNPSFEIIGKAIAFMSTLDSSRAVETPGKAIG